MKHLFILSILYLLYFKATSQNLQKYSELVSVEDRLDGYTYKGIKYAKNGNYNGAYLSFSSALNRANNDKKYIDSCYYNLGVVCLMYRTKTKWQEGIKYLKAIAKVEDFKYYWVNLAIAHILVNEINQAENSISKADTSFAITWYLKGILAYQQKNYQNADKYFQKSLRLKISDVPFLPIAETYYYLRESYNKKDLNEVISLFKKSKNNLEDWYNAIWGQAIANSELGNTKKANKLLDKLNPRDSIVKYAKAFNYFRANEDSLSRKGYQDLIKSNPKFAEAYVGLGHTYVKEASVSNNPKTWKNAINAYTKSIKLKNEPAVYEFRALSWLRLFDYQKENSDSCIYFALNDIATIKKIAPYWNFDYQTVLAEAKAWHYIIFSLAFKRHQSRYFTKDSLREYANFSTACYLTAIEKDSTKSEALEGYASLNFLLEDNQNAKIYYKKAYKIKANETISLGLGTSYFKMDSLEKSTIYFKKTLEFNPYNATALMGLSMIRRNKNDFSVEAIRECEKAYQLGQKLTDDIARASNIFTYAFLKNGEFEQTQYPKTVEGYKEFIKNSVIPIYEEASKITPIADSSNYFVNLGWYANKFGFTYLADSLYIKSKTNVGINNHAVILALNGQINDAVESLEMIKDKLPIAKENLKKIKEGKIKCNCLTEIRIIYLHSGFNLGNIEPKLTNHFFPKYKIYISPIDIFYLEKKPDLSYSYAKTTNNKKHSKGTDCPIY